MLDFIDNIYGFFNFYERIFGFFNQARMPSEFWTTEIDGEFQEVR